MEARHQYSASLQPSAQPGQSQQPKQQQKQQQQQQPLQFHIEPKMEPADTGESHQRHIHGLDMNDECRLTPGHSRLTAYEQRLHDLRKTRGRVKIKMEFIENKLRRYTTFSKRKTGIMKKAYELSTLTGTQVMLLVASETGHVYTFATPKLQPMITSDTGKSLIQTCLNSQDMASPGQQACRMSSTGYEETDLSYCVEEDQKLHVQDSLAAAMMQQPYPTPPPHNSSTDNLVAAVNMGAANLGPHSYGLQLQTPTTPYPMSSSATSPIFSYNQPSLLSDNKPPSPHLSLEDGSSTAFSAQYLSQASPALSTGGKSPPTFYSQFSNRSLTSTDQQQPSAHPTAQFALSQSNRSSSSSLPSLTLAQSNSGSIPQLFKVCSTSAASAPPQVATIYDIGCLPDLSSSGMQLAPCMSALAQ